MIWGRKAWHAMRSMFALDIVIKVDAAAVSWEP